MRLPWRRRELSTRAEAIASIRESFAWFGYPLDDLTDEEIEAGVAEIGRQLATVGVTAREAAESMTTMLSVSGGEIRQE